MMIRPAKEADIDEIMPIVARIKTGYFEKNGIPQWTGSYPSEDIFFDDLDAGHLFVLCQEDLLIGFVSIGFEPEPDYAEIDGKWLNGEPYAVVHRWHRHGLHGSASAETCSHGRKTLRQREIRNIRADTHARTPP
jgi:hypothetical protein